MSSAKAQPSWVRASQPDASLEQRWLVSAPEAKQLIEQGATLLDARSQGFGVRRLQGATVVNWRQFSPTEAAGRGTLVADETQLTRQLQALGISANRPVVVFANPPKGWGEDGRIVWMLRTLGHRQAVMVDGGFQALVRAEVPFQQGTRLAPKPGNFVARHSSAWDIQRDELRDQLGSGSLSIIDTREPREFAGQTPYGERRGGHIPGAINLYFKDFLREDGTLLPQADLLNKLGELGITSDKPVVVYCTGGIRSGWLAAVLATMGFQVKNYAGSMWEWSAASADHYPLETQ
ncbi:MAG: rhodanese-like domain-containing protein [Cyanobacteria bacterium P01_A01_bin.114]